MIVFGPLSKKTKQKQKKKPSAQTQFASTSK